MKLNTVLELPIIRLGIHIAIVIGFVLIIWQAYANWEMDKNIDREEETLFVLKQANIDGRNTRDYDTSDLNLEKYVKRENYKKRGEEVIDTSVIEPSSDSEIGNYLNPSASNQKSNTSLWFDYLFSKNLV